MAIVLLENFAGSEPGIDYRASNFFGAYKGAWLVGSNGGNMSGFPDILTVAEKFGKFWLDSYNTGTRYAGLDITDIVPAGTSRIVLGARFRRKSWAAATAVNLLHSGKANTGLSTYTMAAGLQEFYAEFVIDRSDWSIETWIDGRLANRTTITNGTVKTNLTAGTEQLLFILGSAALTMVTDVVLIVDTGDDTPNSRIGPQDITLIPLEQVQEDPVGEWNTTALGDVLARKDYGVDSGSRVTGLGADAEIKFKPVTGYVLPNDTRVNATAVVVKSTYTPGAPSDLEAVIRRGENQDTALPDQAYTTVLPQIKLINNSRNPVQQAYNTALNGLEVSLKVKSR